MPLQRFILLPALCGMLAACAHLHGGEPCDQLWDRIDYKKQHEEIHRASGVPLPPAQEDSPDDDFGSCASDDLANHGK